MIGFLSWYLESWGRSPEEEESGAGAVECIVDIGQDVSGGDIDSIRL